MVDGGECAVCWSRGQACPQEQGQREAAGGQEYGGETRRCAPVGPFAAACVRGSPAGSVCDQMRPAHTAPAPQAASTNAPLGHPTRILSHGVGVGVSGIHVPPAHSLFFHFAFATASHTSRPTGARWGQARTHTGTTSDATTMAASPARPGSPAALSAVSGATPPRPPPPAALRALDEAYPGKVPVSVIGAHAYVWRVHDASRLRVDHHICGLLIGTLPLIPQQNVFLGLPLQLIPEEVVYLLRVGAIVLIDDVASFDQPSRSDVDRYIAALNDDAARQAAEQDAASKKSRGAAIQKLLQQGGSDTAAATGEDSATLQKAIAKRKAREEKRAMEKERALALAAAADGDAAPSALAASVPPPADTVKAEERGSIAVLGRDEWNQVALPSAYQYTTPAAALEPPLPMDWYHPVQPGSEGARVHTTLSSAKRAGLWVYPRTMTERARCAVFESLHDLGYYMGVGLRFGGDFVVYPGDPLRYHSHFTATVKTSPSAPMSAMELIANGRLGTAVKKAHLIAACDRVRQDDVSPSELQLEDSIDNRFGSVEYFSLTWAGFGT